MQCCGLWQTHTDWDRLTQWDGHTWPRSSESIWAYMCNNTTGLGEDNYVGRTAQHPPPETMTPELMRASLKSNYARHAGVGGQVMAASTDKDGKSSVFLQILESLAERLPQTLAPSQRIYYAQILGVFHLSRLQKKTKRRGTTMSGPPKNNQTHEETASSLKRKKGRNRDPRITQVSCLNGGFP